MTLRSIPIVLLIGMAVACQTTEPAEYDGAALYMGYCAACHGSTGMGDGPVATSMNALVPDLRRIAERHGGAYPRDLVFAVIDGRELRAGHGTQEMPVWGWQFQEAEGVGGKGAKDATRRITALVDFLQRIQLVE